MLHLRLEMKHEKTLTLLQTVCKKPCIASHRTCYLLSLMLKISLTYCLGVGLFPRIILIQISGECKYHFVITTEYKIYHCQQQYLSAAISGIVPVLTILLHNAYVVK